MILRVGLTNGLIYETLKGVLVDLGGWVRELIG